MKVVLLQLSFNCWVVLWTIESEKQIYTKILQGYQKMKEVPYMEIGHFSDQKQKESLNIEKLCDTVQIEKETFHGNIMWQI